MDQLIPSLAFHLVLLANCFRKEVFPTFSRMVGAWIVCLGPRTISRLWETTARTITQHHAAFFRLFADAIWNWDDIMKSILIPIIKVFHLRTRIIMVVDDTLCHKRGAKVAFGGIFLDAVLSTRKHKNFRYRNNWVMLGLVVNMPFRKDRRFCQPLLWRVYEIRDPKNTSQVHRTKLQLAAEMVKIAAGWLENHEIVLVADSAYIGHA